MAYEFRFPDVGEGIHEGELLSWKVREGDLVEEDQTIAEIETDKAVVEIPSPRAGRIVGLHADEGDVIEVGQVLVTIEEAIGAETGAVAEPISAEPSEPEAAPVPREEEEAHRTASIVGQLEEASEEEYVQPPRPTAEKVLALPSVRALAKEFGVDLARVQGTGPRGRILRQDVEDAAEALAYGREVAAPSIPVGEVGIAEPWLEGTIDQDEHGVIERVVLKGVRRTMARKMAESLAKQAQVTTHDEADVTILRRIREKERNLAAERGVRLTYLAFVVKASAAALRRFPRLNASMAESRDEFVVKRYYNIGLAIDTNAGLMVPNIKDADRKSIFQISAEIMDLVEKAQERKLELSELRGGTFTITNYGSIGGLYGTPVTNYPEVAILGMGRVRNVPVVVDGKVAVRQMLPLSLTFDHQLIDGAEAARFLNLLISYVEDPDRLLLEVA